MKYFPKDKKALMMAALGRIPSDLAITNANLVNVFTGEVYKANVFVYDGFIAHVETEDFDEVNAREIIDAKGRFLTPGLIDAHVHIESSMMVPETFCNHVAKCGITTLVAEPHEMANGFFSTFVIANQMTNAIGYYFARFHINSYLVKKFFHFPQQFTQF